MSLATRCPACGTIFRVVQDQLKVSEGWVRCGQCHEVFHGIEALFDLDSDPAVAARRAAARGPAAPPPTRVFADQRASAPIPVPTQAPAAPRPAAPPSPIAIPARPSLTPPSRFGETGPPSQSPTPAARPGYTGFTPATRPLPPAPARPAPFTAPAAPLASPPAPLPSPPAPLPPAPLSSPPPTAPGPTTFSPVATRGTIAPRFAARLAEEAARAQAATAAPTTSPVITSPVAPQTPASSPFGTALAQQPSVSAWQSTPAPHVELAPVAPEPVAPAPPPAIAPVAPEPGPEAAAPALPAFAPTPLPPPPAPSTADDLPPPPSFLMAKPAPAPAPVATPVPEAPAMYIPPSLLARPPVAVPPPPAPEPVVEPVVEAVAEPAPAPTPEPERAPTSLVTQIPESSTPVEAPSAAATLASAFAAPIDAPPPVAPGTLPEPPRTATPIIVREPTPDVGGSTLPSMLADDAADEARAGPPTLASMLPEDAGDWPPKRGKKKAADPDAPESQIVDKTKDPRFLREAKSGARWRRPWVRVVLSLAAIVLVAAALGQVAWPQRDTLAARWPATLPAWQWLCDQADCKIEPPRAIASLTLEDSSLTGTDTDHVLLFSADLHNRAGHEVRMPSFDVRFMDLNGETVARKVLSPEDLGIHQAALPADGELRVHARLQMGSLAASGFQADLFYP